MAVECPDCGADLYESAAGLGFLEIRCEECSYRAHFDYATWIGLMEEDDHYEKD